MTATACAALSLSISRDSEERISRRICHREFCCFAPEAADPLSVAREGICSGPRCMAAMSLPPEPGFSLNYSIARITCSNLLVEADNFVRQYSQV